MASVAAYVDGFNLYYGVKAKYGRRYLWLDLIKLVGALRPHDDIVAVRYFTAVVKGEPAAAANQATYIDALESHCGARLDIRRGWFKTRTIAPCKQCGNHWLCGCQRRYRGYEEKETDVALGVAIVADVASKLADRTLLISADSDFAPAVAAAKRVDPGHPVLLAMPPGNLHPHKRFKDVGHFNINETALRHAQLPETVTDATGKDHCRPAKWS